MSQEWVVTRIYTPKQGWTQHHVYTTENVFQIKLMCASNPRHFSALYLISMYMDTKPTRAADEMVTFNLFQRVSHDNKI